MSAPGIGDAKGTPDGCLLGCLIVVAGVAVLSVIAAAIALGIGGSVR